MRELCVKSLHGRSNNFLGLFPYDLGCVDVDDEQPVISHFVTAQHDTGAGYSDVRGGPDSINRFRTLEICCLKRLLSEIPHRLPHSKSIGVREGFSQTFGVDFFICVHAEDEPVPLRSPF